MGPGAWAFQGLEFLGAFFGLGLNKGFKGFFWHLVLCLFPSEYEENASVELLAFSGVGLNGGITTGSPCKTVPVQEFQILHQVLGTLVLSLWFLLALATDPPEAAPYVHTGQDDPFQESTLFGHPTPPPPPPTRVVKDFPSLPRGLEAGRSRS